jgi:hypothetical protein
MHDSWRISRLQLHTSNFYLWKLDVPKDLKNVWRFIQYEFWWRRIRFLQNMFKKLWWKRMRTKIFGKMPSFFLPSLHQGASFLQCSLNAPLWLYFFLFHSGHFRIYLDMARKRLNVLIAGLRQKCLLTIWQPTKLPCVCWEW